MKEHGIEEALTTGDDFQKYLGTDQGILRSFKTMWWLTAGSSHTCPWLP